MKTCVCCGKPLNSRQTKYCCSKCQIDYQYQQYIKDWKDGKENGLRGEYQISNYIRRYLKEKFGNKCAKCGWAEVNPYTNETPLEIEHIDGNFLNNNEDNLTLLCPNCHSLTSTYKALNKGNGRQARKKYSK